MKTEKLPRKDLLLDKEGSVLHNTSCEPMYQYQLQKKKKKNEKGIKALFNSQASGRSFIEMVNFNIK